MVTNILTKALNNIVLILLGSYNSQIASVFLLRIMVYVPYERFHYTQICNYEHTEIPLYNSTCSSIAKFKASHAQDRRGGVVWVEPVPTSKLMDVSLFAHQRKLCTEGLLG